MAKVFIGFNVFDGFVAASTKSGLAKLIGVSADTVRRKLGKIGRRVVSKSGVPYDIGFCELVKVGGNRGKVRGAGKSGSGGFMGMKGKDGLLTGADGEN